MERAIVEAAGSRVDARGRSATWAAVGFVLVAAGIVPWAWQGGIGPNVRLFQISYLLAFVGYGVVVWVIARADGSAKLGHWWAWLVGCLVLRAALLPSAPSDDLYRYVWEGRIQWAGYSPYLLPPAAPQLESVRDTLWQHINHPESTTVYPPLAQMEFALAALASPTVLAIKSVHVAWDWLSIVVLGAALRRMGLRPHLALVYGLNPLVLAGFGVDGHVDSLMILLMAGAVWAAARQRLIWMGVFLGAAVAAKVTAIVLLPWLAWRSWRAAVAALGVVVGLYLPYVGAGLDLFTGLVRFGSQTECFSAVDALMFVTMPALQPDPLLLRVAVGLIALAWLVGLLRRGAPAVEFGHAAMGVLLVLLPTVHAWYLSWVLMLAAAARRWLWVALSAAGVVYFECEHLRWTTGTWHMTQGPGRVFWGIAALLAGAVMVIRWRRRGADEPVPA